MSRGIQSILVTRRETIVLLRAKPTMAKRVIVTIRMRSSEPIFNQ
jgi:hypothetical protein